MPFHLCAHPLPEWARSELGAPHSSLQGCRRVPTPVPTVCLFASHEDPTCPLHQGLGPSAWVQKPWAPESWDLPWFTVQHQASLLISLSLRSLFYKIKKQNLSFAWLMLNGGKLKIFERLFQAMTICICMSFLVSSLLPST